MTEKPQNITGLVESVSVAKHGIKISEHGWYNATGKAKEYVKANLKNCVVDIKLTGEENKFDFITILQEPMKSSKASSQSEQPELEGYITRDERISRHGAINTAVEIYSKLIKEPGQTLEDPMKELIPLANKVLDYVNDVNGSKK